MSWESSSLVWCFGDASANSTVVAQSLTYPALVGDQIRTERCRDRTWNASSALRKRFGERVGKRVPWTANDA